MTWIKEIKNNIVFMYDTYTYDMYNQLDNQQGIFLV